MNRHLPLPLLIAAVLLAPASAPGGDDTPACVLVSRTAEPYTEVTLHVVKTLNRRALQLDARRPGDLRRLTTDCNDGVIALGKIALAEAGARVKAAPIVFGMVSAAADLLEANPNLSGVTPDADPYEVFAVLRKTNPSVKRVGVVYDPLITGRLVERGHAAAKKRGLELIAIPVKDEGAAVRAFSQFERKIDVDALWLVPDSTATTRDTAYQVLELGQWRRIPVIGISQWYVAHGALLALATDYKAHGQAVGRLANETLGGRDTVSPRVRYTGKYKLLINTRTARRLKLKIDRTLLESAEVMP